MIVYKPTAQIKAISFDLDDTLYDNHPIIVAAEKGLRTFLTTHYPKASLVTPTETKVIKHQLIAKDKGLASDMGELRKQLLRTLLAKDIQNEQELEEATNESFTCFYNLRSDFEVDKNICSLLEELAKNIPLVAITNGNVDIERIGIASYLSHAFHASLTYEKKPALSMFNATSNALGIPPKHILHVGDGLINDVYGAYKAGFASAWFAINRSMDINKEKVRTLPNIQLRELAELLDLIN